SEYRKIRIESANSTHKYFILPILLMVCWIVDSALVLAREHFDYANNSLPDLLTHKIYPEKFWKESDIIATTIILFDLIIYIKLTLNPWIEDRYFMYFIGKPNCANFQLFVNNQGNSNIFFNFNEIND